MLFAHAKHQSGHSLAFFLLLSNICVMGGRAELERAEETTSPKPEKKVRNQRAQTRATQTWAQTQTQLLAQTTNTLNEEDQGQNYT